MTLWLLNEEFSAKITIIINYRESFRCRGEHVRRDLDARDGKNYEQAHTHTWDKHSNDNNEIFQSAEAHTYNITIIIVNTTALGSLIWPHAVLVQ